MHWNLMKDLAAELFIAKDALHIDFEHSLNKEVWRKQPPLWSGFCQSTVRKAASHHMNRRDHPSNNAVAKVERFISKDIMRGYGGKSG